MIWVNDQVSGFGALCLDTGAVVNGQGIARSDIVGSVGVA